MLLTRSLLRRSRSLSGYHKVYSCVPYLILNISLRMIRIFWTKQITFSIRWVLNVDYVNNERYNVEFTICRGGRSDKQIRPHILGYL